MNESGQSITGSRERSVAPVSTVTAPRRAARVPRTLGAGAGLLAVCLILFSAVGAVWGLLRPAFRGTVTEDGGVLLEPQFNVQFTSFISFVVATGLLSLLVSLAVFILSERSRGPGMMLWLLVVTAISALAFHQTGALTASLVHPLPDPGSLDVGTRVSIVPGFAPGIGLAAAPFMAALAYWCSALVTPEEEPGPIPIGWGT